VSSLADGPAVAGQRRGSRTWRSVVLAFTAGFFCTMGVSIAWFIPELDADTNAGWFPAVLLTMSLLAVVSAVLMIRRRTRCQGLGLFGGVVAALAVHVAFFIWVLSGVA
jgi:hypothetical protein